MLVLKIRRIVWGLGLVAVLSLAAAVPAPVWAKTSERSAESAGQGRNAKATERAGARKPAASTVPRQFRAAGNTPAAKSRTAKVSAVRAGKSAPAASRGAASARKGAGGARAAGVRAAKAVAVPSIGQLSGLHAVDDPLDLKSGVALVVDDESRQVLFSKNPDAVLPIASITKLMTALVVVESGQPLDELLSIGQEDIENTQNVRSRLAPGTSLTRSELLRLALMASENRAAAALARHHPGGVPAFVRAMNAKAAQLGMRDSQFVESTGLSPENRASALDLTRLVAASSAHEIIREYSVSKESVVPVGVQDRAVQFRSTNGLIGNPEWDILLQKTGYISAAGRCLVMQASLAGRRLTMVLLDSAGKYSRFGDAERLRKWLVDHLPAGQALAATASLPLNAGAPASVQPLLPQVVPQVLPSVSVGGGTR